MLVCPLSAGMAAGFLAIRGVAHVLNGSTTAFDADATVLDSVIALSVIWQPR
jgi:hypothetical protein